MKKTSLRAILLIVAAAVTVLKLWLMRAQPVFAIGGAAIDDRLFVELGNSIRHGDWLGQYNFLTLSKGPFYPLWIAASNLCGIPLRLGEQFLYAAGCGLLVLALAPAIRSLWMRFALYLLVLFNPMTWDMTSLARVLRQNIYTPLTLVALSCALAVMARAGERARSLRLWAWGFGLSFAGFWLTREESIWFAPSLWLILAASFYYAWRRAGRAGLFRQAAVCCHAATAAALPILAICFLNLHYYGWFGTVEFKAEAFNDAYGALLRITPRERYPGVPVSRETRLRAYAVSPTFAKLKPYLEGGVGAWGAGCSAPFTGIPAERLEIAGGWFMWSLRQAASDAGYSKSARENLRFFRRVADELNTACDAGLIEGGSRRSGFLPPLRSEQLKAFGKALGEFAFYFASFGDFSAYAGPSEGDSASLAFFREVTLERPSEKDGHRTGIGPSERSLDEGRLAVLQSLGKGLRWPLFAAISAAQALAALLLLRALRRRELSPLLVAAAAAWGGAAATLAVNVLVHVTSFPNHSISALAQAYPLILVFVGIVAAELVRIAGESGD